MARITKLELDLKILRQKSGKIKRKLTLMGKRMAKIKETIDAYKKAFDI